MLWQHPVHPALTGLVERIVGYDDRPDPASVHHGLPGPATTVILSFDEPLDVGWASGSERGRRWRLASGLHVGPALIHTHGHQHGIQLSLTPAGTRALLGVPMAGLTHAFEAPLGLPDDLHARLAALDWPERFALLDAHLLRLIGRARTEVPADLAHGWALLARRAGAMGVAELAGTLGWSRRHLTARFTAEFGLPPREVARLHRFAAALRLARSRTPWSQVASRAGFADQPHLVREFGALAGQTPTQWAAEVFPNLQDTGAPTG